MAFPSFALVRMKNGRTITVVLLRLLVVSFVLAGVLLLLFISSRVVAVPFFATVVFREGMAGAFLPFPARTSTLLLQPRWRIAILAYKRIKSLRTNCYSDANPSGQIVIKTQPAKVCSKIGLCIFNGAEYISNDIQYVVDKRKETSLNADVLCTACEMAVVWMENQLRENETKERILAYANQADASQHSSPYSPPDLNKNITQIFGKLIDIYIVLGDDRRSFSYYKAIPVIEKLPFKIESVDQVKDLPTIGKALQDHIHEIITKGKLSKLEHFEND